MEEPPQGESWGSEDLPADSSFTYGSFVYGGWTYTTRQQQVWTHLLPTHLGFQGPRQQQQGKRGRVSEAAILRLLREVEVTSTPADDCCAICLEDFAAAAPAPLTLRAMPGCSHAFHQHCILQWLRLNAVCPVCRHQLPTEEEEEEEQRRPMRPMRRRRRRSVYDDWLSFRGSRAQSPSTREEED